MKTTPLSALALPAVLALVAALSAHAAPATAQENVPLSEADAAAVADYYNRPTTTRLAGETRIARGARLEGDVATLGGPLVVAGTVAGDVMVINGDVRLEPGARVEGALVVVGGRVEGDTAAVAGGLTVYAEALRFRREGERIIALGPSRPSGLSAGASTWFGRTDLVLAVEGSYNRVEGLPVTAGPRFELGHANPTVLDARLSYRTRNGLRIHPHELGYRVVLEQFVGGQRSLALGATLHSSIDPIEDGGLTDTENSLSTFVLHRDYRDHYEREGWSAYVRFLGRTRPYDARIEYRSERHGSVAPGEPWSLLKNNEPWRPQPQVAEGDLRSIRAWLQWDTRNDRTQPATGWLVQIEAEQGLEGDLRMLYVDPVSSVPATLVSRPVKAEFTALRVDARRFLRMGPQTRLALRGVVAGSPDDGPLPPQRQHRLGGEGGLPGYERFSLDCGARALGPTIDGYLPYYGCDRMVLLQGELRYGILGRERLSRRLGLDLDLVGTPELILFADAGRAWIEAESLDERAEVGPHALRYDAGFGLRLGRLGAYLAVPLSGEGGRPNFFVRLEPRI